MKKTVSILAMALSIIAVSCTKEPVKGVSEFKASIVPQSRVGLSIEGSAGKLAWTAGDESQLPSFHMG